ncbi:MAG: Na+/H+ antiporter subunit E [Bacillota bacterium]
MKYNFKILLSMFLFWVFLTKDISMQNIIIGLLVSAFVMIVFDIKLETKYNGKYVFFRITYFGVIVFLNIYKASIEYIGKIFTNKGKAKVVNIDIDIIKERNAILIANAITLTPGTITLKIFGDNSLKVLIQVEKEKDIASFKEEILNYKRILEKSELYD